MATIGTAEQKWERKMANAGAKWYNRVQGRATDYCAGVSNFIGEPATQCPGAAWQAGVDAVGAQGFQQAVAGKGAKWRQEFINRFTGR